MDITKMQRNKANEGTNKQTNKQTDKQTDRHTLTVAAMCTLVKMLVMHEIDSPMRRRWKLSGIARKRWEAEQHNPT